jgi:peptide/nickel transport system substrate-binding protein
MEEKMRVSKWFLISLVAVMITALALSACGTPATGTTTAVQPTTEQAASTPAPTGPVVGGTLVLADTNEPDTLDIQKSSYGITSWVISYLGGSLIAKDLQGKYIPYIAESWSASPDGLVWTFKIKQGVKFSNGDPLTAKDWVYTIERARDPATNSPVSASLVTPIDKAEAIDDYTLQLTLTAPFYPILENFTSTYLMPYDQKAVEAEGDNYGRNPVGAGPYMFKEWVTDEKVVLQRNPDFNWGPIAFDGANPGPYYIDTVEFRVIPEYSTMLAGLQAGDLDIISRTEAKDVQLIRDTGMYNIFEGISSATFHVTVNNEVAPFDNEKVRQAFEMATDRNAIIQIVTLGSAVPLHGPISPSVIGYDPEVENHGFNYDLAGAKALMQEAGFTYGSDGMLINPDGTPFELVLKTPTIDSYVKTAQVLSDQWTTFGVKVTIEQYEWGTLSPQYVGGDYTVGTLEIGWPEADILYLWFHSSAIGALNWNRVQDPTLDALLEKTRTLTDATERQAAVRDAQFYIADHAFMFPIFAFKDFLVVSNKLDGVQWSPLAGLVLSDAFFK